MNLKGLTAFIEVAEQAHFGKAAAALNITQPGLSQMIKKLEHNVGAKLIVRTTRSVSLTELGEIYLQHARDLVLAHELFRQRMEEAIGGESGTVKLGFVASAALGLLPRITAELHQRAPGIKLSLVEMTSDIQLTKLQTGVIDVGLLREIDYFPGLVLHLLATEPLLLAVHKTHTLSNEKRVSLTTLKGEGFVMFPRTEVSHLHDHIYNICSQAGFIPNVVEEAVQFATLLGLVSSNAGIAIVPKSVNSIQLPNVTFLEIEDPIARSKIYLARREEERSSPAAKKLIEIISQFGKSLP